MSSFCCGVAGLTTNSTDEADGAAKAGTTTAEQTAKSLGAFSGLTETSFFQVMSDGTREGIEIVSNACTALVEHDVEEEEPTRDLTVVQEQPQQPQTESPSEVGVKPPVEVPPPSAADPSEKAKDDKPVEAKSVSDEGTDSTVTAAPKADEAPVVAEESTLPVEKEAAAPKPVDAPPVEEETAPKPVEETTPTEEDTSKSVVEETTDESEVTTTPVEAPEATADDTTTPSAEESKPMETTTTTSPAEETTPTDVPAEASTTPTEEESKSTEVTAEAMTTPTEESDATTTTPAEETTLTEVTAEATKTTAAEEESKPTEVATEATTTPAEEEESKPVEKTKDVLKPEVDDVTKPEEENASEPEAIGEPSKTTARPSSVSAVESDEGEGIELVPPGTSPEAAADEESASPVEGEAAATDEPTDEDGTMSQADVELEPSASPDAELVESKVEQEERDSPVAVVDTPTADDLDITPSSTANEEATEEKVTPASEPIVSTDGQSMERCLTVDDDAPIVPAIDEEQQQVGVERVLTIAEEGQEEVDEEEEKEAAAAVPASSTTQGVERVLSTADCPQSLEGVTPSTDAGESTQERDDVAENTAGASTTESPKEAEEEGTEEREAIADDDIPKTSTPTEATEGLGMERILSPTPPANGDEPDETSTPESTPQPEDDPTTAIEEESKPQTEEVLTTAVEDDATETMPQTEEVPTTTVEDDTTESTPQTEEVPSIDSTPQTEEAPTNAIEDDATESTPQTEEAPVTSAEDDGETVDDELAEKEVETVEATTAAVDDISNAEDSSTPQEPVATQADATPAADEEEEAVPFDEPPSVSSRELPLSPSDEKETEECSDPVSVSEEASLKPEGDPSLVSKSEEEEALRMAEEAVSDADPSLVFKSEEEVELKMAQQKAARDADPFLITKSEEEAAFQMAEEKQDRFFGADSKESGDNVLSEIYAGLASSGSGLLSLGLDQGQAEATSPVKGSRGSKNEIASQAQAAAVEMFALRIAASCDEVGMQEEEVAYRAMLEEQEKEEKESMAAEEALRATMTTETVETHRSSAFPFDSLVITSPDAMSAEAGTKGGIKQLKSSLPSDVEVFSTSDPYGARCGSGGGTLAALEEVGDLGLGQAVLIVHAGGDSSRCPTQMVLGKSYTTLPTNRNGLMDPTRRLVSQLGGLCEGLPEGSIVVAASDTLLSLPLESSVDWSRCDEMSVLGLAVPAPHETAKNHGVYCLDSKDHGVIRKVTNFLQKPPVEELRSLDAADDGNSWIDTGVVIFLPKAAEALRTLCREGARVCTRAGLQAIWEECKESETDEEQPLEEFARGHAVKVELYTHLLKALQLSSAEPIEMLDSLDQFHNAFGEELPPDVLHSIHRALHKFRLKAITVPAGQFLHLGTTRELVDLLVQGCSTAPPANHFEKRCQQFGKDLGLVRRLGTYIMPATHVAHSSVIINSCLTATGSVTVGNGTVIEHSILVVDGDVDVGSNCLLSGVRGKATGLLKVPSGMCLQSLELQACGSFVFMYFGLDDKIKSRSTIFGLPFDVLMEKVGLTDADLWDESVETKTLWTANIHPIIGAGNLFFCDLFDWVTELVEGADTLSSRGQETLETWKSCKRTCLREIRGQADASKEWSSRSEIQTKFLPAKESMLFESILVGLVKREHREFDFDYLVQESEASGNHGLLRIIVQTLDQAIMSSFRSELYDVTARSLMVLKSLILKASDLGVLPFDEVQVNSLAMIGIDSDISSTTDRIASIDKAVEKLTRNCVFGSDHARTFERQNAHVPAGKWVVSSAPARVDFSGGWTDTPPVCYEYGGAVFGAAVRVDGAKPLQCRTRLVEHGEGTVVLRCEQRNPLDGTLVGEPVEVACTQLTDFADHNDPSADCALLKCALVYLGITPVDSMVGGKLTFVSQVFSNVKEACGLEIITTSLLPLGSGMGTSSILAGCVLTSVAKCFGIKIVDLTQSVLELEQMLTTGGGWQDQVNGLVGGYKLASSEAHKFPLTTCVEHLDVSCVDMSKRLVLGFSGKTRLAKDILKQVLERWALRKSEIMSAVSDLVEGAYQAYAAVECNDVAELASCLNRYWDLKKVMAGPGSGVEPEAVGILLSKLQLDKTILGGSLCGAGGGGFLLVITAANKTIDDVKVAASLVKGAESFTWHTCEVSDEGVTTRVVDELPTTDSFELAWHE